MSKKQAGKRAQAKSKVDVGQIFAVLGVEGADEALDAIGRIQNTNKVLLEAGNAQQIMLTLSINPITGIYTSSTNIGGQDDRGEVLKALMRLQSAISDVQQKISQQLMQMQAAQQAEMDQIKQMAANGHTFVPTPGTDPVKVEASGQPGGDAA